MERKKKIGIIGAGLSGITAIKQLRDEGHEVVCYEKSESVGGVFSKNKIYEGLHLTISNYFMAYSDFLPTNERLKFWSKLEYRNYLNAYVDKFDLGTSINYNTEVVAVRQDKKGEKWTIEVNSEGKNQVMEFDGVVICSGHFQSPKIPKFEGLDQFEGNVIHSKTYRDKELYRGKKVLCIGMGESSADITSEVSEVAAKCTLSLRRYHAVAPRYMSFQEDTFFTIDTSWLTSRIVNKLPKYFHNRFTNKIFAKYVNSYNPDVRIRGTWLLNSGGSNNQAVTKNERVFKHIADGQVIPNIGGIERFDRTGVVFKDGTREEIDEVICCTGYDLKFPFLDFDVKNMRNLFKQMFIPEIGPSLAFVGFVRPQQGGIPVISEMQSRYLAQIMSGNLSLPSVEVQKEKIEKDTMHWRHEYKVTPDVPSLVNYCHYMDSLAQLVGCMPKIPTALQDAKLRNRLLHGPQFAAQYRLNGPHSSQDVARDFITSFPEITTRRKVLLHEASLALCKVLSWSPKWQLRQLETV